MRSATWITCLWPGLPRLWLRGELSGLATAVGFTALLNLVLVASFIWPELVGSAWLAAGWLFVGCSWCLCVGRSVGQLARMRRLSGVRGGEDLFIQAQTEYLRSHWFEAESLLRRLVDGGGDADALLMLVALYRRTNRLAEARRRLRLLERLGGAEKWRLELSCERRLLERMERLEATTKDEDLVGPEADDEDGRPQASEAA